MKVGAAEQSWTADLEVCLPHAWCPLHQGARPTLHPLHAVHAARPNPAGFHVLATRLPTPLPQLSEESLTADGNYSSTLTIVTVEPAGLSDSHADKLRLLLVRWRGGWLLCRARVWLLLLFGAGGGEQASLC